MVKARDNPLATERVLQAIRYRPVGTTLSALWDRLVLLDFRCAIVGPHGSGKTTLIEHLADQLPEVGLMPRAVRLSTERRSIDSNLLAKLNARDVVLLDGAEQLSAFSWLRLRWCCRQARGLVITSHRAGRLPTLLNTTTSASLLEGILSDLGVSCSGAEDLFKRHRGNLREAIFELYDLQSLMADGRSTV